MGIHQGDALDLPFDDDSFDVVWTQHVSMNSADKAGLFAEMRRVARTGGRLAFFDILAGPVAPIRFPVPWADHPSVSHLATAEETREAVSDTPPEPQPLGLHLLTPDMATKGADLKRNVEEGRIIVVRSVADVVRQ